MMVGEVELEPTKAQASGFTGRPLSLPLQQDPHKDGFADFTHPSRDTAPFFFIDVSVFKRSLNNYEGKRDFLQEAHLDWGSECGPFRGRACHRRPNYSLARRR